MDNSFKIDGTILAIDKTRPSKEGSTFMLRDFWLDKPIMGDSCEIKFQLKGNNCTKMDNFLPGDEVVVDFALLGMCKPKEDKIGCDTNPNKLDGFSPNVTAFKIEFAPGFVRKAPQPVFNQSASTPSHSDPRVGQINPATQKVWTEQELKDDMPF